MKYAVIYSSKTGNTEFLASTIRGLNQAGDCVYFGLPPSYDIEADLIFIGFWTHLGECDSTTKDFLSRLRNKSVFLFGTAGFGMDQGYFDKILKRTEKNLDKSVKILGSFMCQGKMPESVLRKYEKQLALPIHIPYVKNMIVNYYDALDHPDETDLKNLMLAVSNAIVELN